MKRIGNHWLSDGGQSLVQIIGTGRGGPWVIMDPEWHEVPQLIEALHEALAEHQKSEATNDYR